MDGGWLSIAEPTSDRSGGYGDGRDLLVFVVCRCRSCCCARLSALTLSAAPGAVSTLTDALPLFEHEACVLSAVLLHLGVCVCGVCRLLRILPARGRESRSREVMEGLFGLSDCLSVRMSVCPRGCVVNAYVEKWMIKSM